MTETFLPFKFGAFRLAIEAQVPIVPVVISSYKPIYNADRQANVYYWRHGSISVTCLEPIATTGMTIDNDLHRLTDMTRQRMMIAYENLVTLPDDKKDQ
jgi:1-acyl-sn-glycerol-3-phosphate acyltransferase